MKETFKIGDLVHITWQGKKAIFKIIGINNEHEKERFLTKLVNKNGETSSLILHDGINVWPYYDEYGNEVKLNPALENKCWTSERSLVKVKE